MKEELIKEIELLKNRLENTECIDEVYEKQIKDYLRQIKLTLTQNEAEQLKENTDKPYIYMGVIKKYIRKTNSCRFDKEDQSKLTKQLYAINKGSITLISVLKYLELPYSYINNDKFGTWKDIIVFPSKTIKETYDLGLIQEEDILFGWMPKKYTKNAK